MRFKVVVIALLISLPPSYAAEVKQSEADRRAFVRARKAATTQSWDAAIAILKGINIDKLEDVEVIEYVVFSRLCAKTAEALGVDRKSNPDSPTDVVTQLDWEKLVAKLVEQSLKNPTKVAGLLSDARKVQKGIPRYQELDRTLAKRSASR